MKLKTSRIGDITFGTNILDIEVPEALKKKFKTGLKFVDGAMGGEGFTPSSVTLFTGEPGAGKTTMMRAISNNQVEGFPYKDVRTIFIENDIQGSQMSMNVVEFLLDTMGFDLKYTPEEAKAALLGSRYRRCLIVPRCLCSKT